MLVEYFGDLHVHLGRTLDGRPVKVTAARNQTLPNVLEEARKKGLNILGIVDCACPQIYVELEEMLSQGKAEELRQGGIRCADDLTIIPGVEIEATEKNGGHAHWLAYFAHLDQLRSFIKFLTKHLSNPNLSTQKCHLPARALLSEVRERGGIFFPAHAFTPHQGVYGQCTASLRQLLGDDGFQLIFALELGLSADTELADHLAELSEITFLSNSDAHSLKSLGREYNIFELEAATWEELLKALKREEGRKVKANYGLDPRLGKYHRTFCLVCKKIAEEKPPVLKCPNCGSQNVVKGVLDRIREIGNWPEPHSPLHRPPYYYQVPLHFLPGVGPKTIEKLLARFGTEMKVLHSASLEELKETVGTTIAELIWKARQGKLKIEAGGGGTYGKVYKEAKVGDEIRHCGC
jgi:uncharacterized protein (TIGR00375 family)